MASPPDCAALRGVPDLYGLGVRIGVYAQWAATLLTTVFDPANENTLRLLNLIVQTAIFLGLCVDGGHGAGSAAGAVATMVLLCGSLSSVTGDGVSHRAHGSGLVRALFYAGLAAYAVWFWFVGVDDMLRPGCPPEVAFFGPSSMVGWVRSVARVLAVAGLVACVALAASSVYAIAARFRRGLRAAFARPPCRRPQVELALLLLSVGLMGLSVATVEYVLRVNEVADVGADSIGSVGQLIPLLAGTLACFLTLWKVLVGGLIFQRRCWLLFGRHL